MFHNYLNLLKIKLSKSNFYELELYCSESVFNN